MRPRGTVLLNLSERIRSQVLRPCECGVQVPEVRRVPLEGLALQVKLLRPHAPVAAFLAAMMEPPPREARTPHALHSQCIYVT